MSPTRARWPLAAALILAGLLFRWGWSPTKPDRTFTPDDETFRDHVEVFGGRVAAGTVGGRWDADPWRNLALEYRDPVTGEARKGWTFVGPLGYWMTEIG